MAALKMIRGPELGWEFPLDGDCVLGRDPTCDIFEFFRDVNAVSRKHARIIRDGPHFFIQDTKSRNGTLVNDRPISQQVALSDGDRVTICDIEFQFVHADPALFPPTVSRLTESSVAGAMLVDDEPSGSGSTIMSQVDVPSSSSRSGVRLAANAQTKLRALVEMLGNLGRSLALDDVLDNLLSGLFKVFVQADRGFIGLKLPGDGPVVPRAVKHRHGDDGETVRISRTIVNQVIESKKAILSADAANDSRFDMAQSITEFQIRSMMCAPLLDAEENVLGVIQIDTLDQRSRFQHEDLEVLASVAPQAAFALQYAQLHEGALRRQALERDMQLARKVQHGLLPEASPHLEGYHFFNFYEPAFEVGGDYYDYVPLSGGRLGVVLADVSGKGVSAALLMANLSGELKYCLASEPTPVDAINRINADFDKSGWEDHFVTLVLAVLDPRRHEVTLVNAGHMAPIMRHSDGRVEMVGEEASGFPLGVEAGHGYQEYKLSLEAGDSLTLFTDGFSEAISSGGELYGLERLRQQAGGDVRDVSQLGEHILTDVKTYVRGHPQSDDMCLVCFGRRKEG